MVPEELDTFIQGILEDKQLPGLDDEVRAQLVRDLRERLLDQINAAVIESLPEASLNALDAAMDNPETSEVEVQRVIAESGIDIKRITVETMLRFRDLYLGTYNKAG